MAKKRRHVQPYQFINKKALLTNIDDSSLIEIQNQFNNLPRKVLGYKTPLELFTKYLKRVELGT
jgi:IS30 family transposase